jgi:hypothetical protein
MFQEMNQQVSRQGLVSMTGTRVHRRLRTKIIAWSFIPPAIILSAFAWMAYSSSQKDIGDQAMLEDQQLVTAKSAHVTQAVAILVNPPLQSIMLEVDTNHGEPLERRARKILLETYQIENFDGGVFFVDQAGKVVITWQLLVNKKTSLLY